MPVPLRCCPALLGFVFLVCLTAGQAEEKKEAPESPKAETPDTTEGTSPAPKPAAEPTPTFLVRQGTLPNPVADEVTLINRRQLSQGKPGAITSLPGLITVHHLDSRLSYAWDPVECRLLFAWWGENMSDLIYVAEGSAPFAVTIGAWGPPTFFGYRESADGPEFLYHFGRLAVAERIRPMKGGAGWVQEWEVTQADFGLQVTVPERWRDRVQPSTGTWSGQSLSLSQAQATKFSLTWNMASPPALPALPESWIAYFSPPAPATNSSGPTPTAPSSKPDAKQESANE